MFVVFCGVFGFRSGVDQLIAQVVLGHVDAVLFARVFLYEAEQLRCVLGANQELAVDPGSFTVNFFDHGLGFFSCSLVCWSQLFDHSILASPTRNVSTTAFMLDAVSTVGSYRNDVSGVTSNTVSSLITV